MSDKLTLRSVWREFNVSSVLLLPAIAQEIVPSARLSPNAAKVSEYHPLQVLAIGGYKNGFLYREAPRYDGTYCLLFESDKLWKKIKTLNESFISISELLASTELLTDYGVCESGTWFQIRVEDIFKEEDIHRIERSKYSEVSTELVDKVDISKAGIKKVLILEKSLEWANYVITQNLAGAIMRKQDFVRDEIEQILGMNIHPQQEVYELFDKEQETLSVIQKQFFIY